MLSLPTSFLSEPIAHRGLHDLANRVQENSPSSFEAAIEGGYGIELDLQLSSDGEAMVFHDYMLERLTDEAGPIRQRTAAELQQIRHRVGGEPILALSELLDIVSGQVPLLIEMKDQDGACGPNVGRLEHRVAGLLKKYAGDVAVMSYNPHSTMMMSVLAPDIPRGLTTDGFTSDGWPMMPRQRAEELAQIPDFDRTGACFISHDHNLLDAAPVTALKARGVPILCWTIRSVAEEIKARRIADNITFEGYIPAKLSDSEE